MPNPRLPKYSKFSKQTINRYRGKFGRINPTIQRERVTEFGKPMGGNPLKQNPKLNHGAARDPKFSAPMVAAIRKRRGGTSVQSLRHH